MSYRDICASIHTLTLPLLSFPLFSLIPKKPPFLSHLPPPQLYLPLRALRLSLRLCLCLHLRSALAPAPQPLTRSALPDPELLVGNANRNAAHEAGGASAALDPGPPGARDTRAAASDARRAAHADAGGGAGALAAAPPWS